MTKARQTEKYYECRKSNPQTDNFFVFSQLRSFPASYSRRARFSDAVFSFSGCLKSPADRKHAGWRYPARCRCCRGQNPPPPLRRSSHSPPAQECRTVSRNPWRSSGSRRSPRRLSERVHAPPEKPRHKPGIFLYILFGAPVLLRKSSHLYLFHHTFSLDFFPSHHTIS